MNRDFAFKRTYAPKTSFARTLVTVCRHGNREPCYRHAGRLLHLPQHAKPQYAPMAAIQSGIDARYPGYSPDGYASTLPHPVQRRGSCHEVLPTLTAAKASSLTQQKSSWDSSAVKQYVDSQNPSAIATQIDGLTIYSYGGNAALQTAASSTLSMATHHRQMSKSNASPRVSSYTYTISSAILR